ncbi:hypothetical protein FKM82_011442 [Ascaphus truei]
MTPLCSSHNSLPLSLPCIGEFRERMYKTPGIVTGKIRGLAIRRGPAPSRGLGSSVNPASAVLNNCSDCSNKALYFIYPCLSVQSIGQEGK